MHEDTDKYVLLKSQSFFFFTANHFLLLLQKTIIIITTRRKEKYFKIKDFRMARVASALLIGCLHSNGIAISIKTNWKRDF